MSRAASSSCRSTAPSRSLRPPPHWRTCAPTPTSARSCWWFERARGLRRAAASPALHALGVDVQRIDRVARGHEQAVALDAAEAHVGAALGQRDESDRLAGGIEDLDPIL